MVISEFKTVVLTRDIPGHRLKAGDVGAVVHRYANAKKYEVEFVTGKGSTIAVLTLSESDLRIMAGEEILHVRGFVSA